MRSNLFTLIGVLVLVLVVFQQKAFSQNESISGEGDFFEMSIEDLMNQSITTVSKSEEKISDAPGIVSVLSKEDIKMFGGTTLSTVLERIPGLSATTALFSDRSIISSRGEQITSTSNHVLLLINGRPVRESLEGGVSSEMYESFPINVIERIEVIKGPGSVLYGSNAFSGVINIITQVADGNSVSLSTLGGLNGTLGASGNVKIKSGEFEMIASGQYLQKPVWETEYSYIPSQQGIEPAGNELGNNLLVDLDPNLGETAGIVPSPINNQSLTQNISIPNEGTGLFLNAKYKNLNFTSTYNQWETLGFESPGATRWSKNFNNLGYDLKFNDKWNSNVNLTLTNSWFETDSFPNIKRNSYEMLAEWTNHVALWEKAKLVFGGLYSFSKGEEMNVSKASAGVEGQRYSYGAYAQADYQLFEALKLTAGMQVNKIEGIDPNIVPRASLVWNPSENWNFKALYSEAFRAPSIIELSIDQTFRQGNNSLNPETVGTIDLAANYLNDKFQIGVNYFHSKLEDIIMLDHSFDIPTYQNTGTVIFNGAEMETKYYLGENLFLTGSALYQINKTPDQQNNIVKSSSFYAKAGVNYTSNRGISLGLFNIYQGKLDEVYTSALNVAPTSAYNKLSFHADLNAKKLFLPNLKQDVSVFLHADNLLNKEVWVYTQQGEQSNSIPFNQGRVVYAGLSVKF